MTPDQFIAEIRKQVVREQVSEDLAILASDISEDSCIPYWRGAIRLYRNLDEPSRAVLLDIIRQAKVDALAGLFGFLDGVSYLIPREDFILTSLPDQQKLNGELLDLFLLAEEEAEEGGKL